MPWYGTSTGSGTTAGGINIKGSVPTKDNLPATGSANDAYLTKDTGHLWVWDGSKYVDAGPISGPTGPRGPAGTNGTDGMAPIITEGFITVLASDATPTVDVVETGPGTYRIDFGIPAGGAGTGEGTPQKQAYTFTQSSPTKVWTFTHDLSFHPAGMDIEDADAPDAEWTVPVTYVAATKTYTFTFPVPVRGSVTVS